MKVLLRLSRLAVFALSLGALQAGASEYGNRVSNLSSRGLAGSGTDTMITGFVVGAGGPKQILVRAVGPTLSSYGVSGVLGNPVLSLYDSGGNLLGSNSGWLAADAGTMSSVGAFPLPSGSSDAALVMTLSAGTYTAQVTGATGASGVALLEVYDVTGVAQLLNISTRGYVGTGPSTIISGLVIAPASGPRELLIRVAGPALASYGVSGVVANPSLTVMDSSGDVLATDAGWSTGDTDGQLTAAFAAAGAFAFAPGSADSAVLLDLPSGSYTIQATANGAPGVGLVEVYDITPASSSSSGSPSSGASGQPLYVASLAVGSGSTSTAYGVATLQLNSDLQTAVLSVAFANLSSPEVEAHLVVKGVNIADLPSGQISEALVSLAATGSLSQPQIIQAIESGEATIEVDTTKFPGGELTGGFLVNSGPPVFVVPSAPPAYNLSAAPSQSDAARFLTQATFGPTQADLTNVIKQGYPAWISAQMALPPTSHDTATMNDFAQNNLDGQGTQANGLYPFPGGTNRQAAWWQIAVTAPDQLRQRVAFALSEMFVVSDQNAYVNMWQEGAANFYDVLVNNAFGNFRTLLEQVTLHPIMGIYLNMLQNAQGTYDAQGNPMTIANENYAREVMQLFTIGLYQLNPDGSLQLDSNGAPIPTYDQDTITQTAKVFTGWGFAPGAPADANFFNTGNGSAYWTTPMVLYPDYHDNTAKTIVGGQAIPAGQGGSADLEATLDALFNHPNTAPFIARELIQHLVTSNPSPGYVYRIAQVFADDGTGVRGNLAAVVTAILTDYEARSDSMIGTATFGKIKEPILLATALMRAFGATSNSGRYNIDAYPQLDEAPLRAPDVFNFFGPGFSQPGSVAAAGMVSPEFEILNDTTAITGPDFYNFYIYNPQPGIPSAANAQSIYMNYSSLLPLAGTPQQLVSQINLLLCSSQLSTTTNNLIVSALNQLPDNTQADALDRVETAVFLVVTSPDAAVQQ